MYAPTNSIFICRHDIDIRYTERIAMNIGRSDITVFSKDQLERSILMRITNEYLVLDHDVELSEDTLQYIRNSGIRCLFQLLKVF